MDIYCPICAEPWDIDSLHEEIQLRHPTTPWRNIKDSAKRQAEYERKYYNVVKTEFRRNGCNALVEFNGGTATWCKPTPDRAAAEMIVAAMSLSDHVDDWASDLDGLI